MKASIETFWLRYSQLQQAVSSDESFLIDYLDGEIDPLLQGIIDQRATTVGDAGLQFHFLLNLLRNEADDTSSVMRHSSALLRILKRYFIEPGTGNLGVRYQAETPALAAMPSPGISDGGLLNEAILDSLPDCVCVVAPDYRYLYANTLHAERMALTRTTLIGRPVLEFVGLQTFETDMKPGLDRCFMGEVVDVTSAQDILGRTVVIRSRMTPCRASSNQIIGAIVVRQEQANRRRVIAA